MAEQPDTPPSEEGRAERLARRKQQRQRLRRRRFATAGALLACTVAIAAAIGLSPSGGGTAHDTAKQVPDVRATARRGTDHETGYTGATTEIPGDATRESPDGLARFEILGSTGASGLAEDLR